MNDLLPSDKKLAWIEPTVEKLDVRETSMYPEAGGDNFLHKPGRFGVYVPDCTAS